MSTHPGTELVVDATSIAVGGDAVARSTDGQVVFVPGALPGEQLRVRVRTAHARYLHADLLEVVMPSAGRIEPACPHVAEGCGGCGWAHMAIDGQRSAKVQMVAEALERLGGIDAPVVDAGPELATTGHRSTVRAAVLDGRGGYRLAASSERLAVSSCRVAHPLVAEMLVEGRFGAADEVVLRAGTRTGERLARIAPTAADVALPSDVLVVGADELAAGRRAWIHEVVAGVRLRISADSFFQSRADGADMLVAAVADAVDGHAPDASMADLYCGVGLFAATVGAGRRVVAVERSPSSVADARANLASGEVRVVRSAVERWRPSRVDVVVADPPRSGLGSRVVDVIGRTGAVTLALVSCDAGALGRDAGLLRRAGWTLEWSRLVDLFPDTPRVEVVSRFTR